MQNSLLNRIIDFLREIFLKGLFVLFVVYADSGAPSSHSGIFSLCTVNDNALPQGCYMECTFSVVLCVAENLLPVYVYIHIRRTSYMSYVLRILCAYLCEILQYLEVILTANKRANDQI